MNIRRHAARMQVVIAGLLGGVGCGSTSTTGGALPSLADAAARGPTGCGTGNGQRDLSNRSTTAAAKKRTYLLYLPKSLDPAKPAPLVFVMHGATMSGQMMHDITRYSALADKEGIAVAFPDGESGPGSFAPWNVGSGVCGNGAMADAPGDDFSFLEAMHADIDKDQCIDADHVFVTGFSMGGYFSHHVGCMRPDLARAIAPHSGGTHDFGTCAPGHKPVIIFHGDADMLIADGCDDPNAPGVPGSTPSATLWAEKNGCSSTVTTMPVQNGHCDIYQGCPKDGQVELCVFTGMGHCWAGGAAGAQFSCPSYESATQLEWDFFKKYAW